MARFTGRLGCTGVCRAMPHSTRPGSQQASGMHILEDAVICVNHMDVVDRQEDEFCSANYILRGHRAKDARISTVIPVIAQHKILPWAEFHIGQNGAAADLAGREGIGVWFLEHDIIYDDLGQGDGDCVTWDSDDSLDIGFTRWVARRVEDNDIATLWGAAESVGKLFYQQEVARVEPRLHGLFFK